MLQAMGRLNQVTKIDLQSSTEYQPPDSIRVRFG